MRLLLYKQLEASAGRGATACNNTDGRLVWGSEVEIGGSDQEGAWGLFTMTAEEVAGYCGGDREENRRCDAMRRIWGKLM